MSISPEQTNQTLAFWWPLKCSNANGLQGHCRGCLTVLADIFFVGSINEMYTFKINALLCLFLLPQFLYTLVTVLSLCCPLSSAEENKLPR